MARYNTATMARPAQKASAIKSGTRTATNHQGGIGVIRDDAKSELFLSAATSFVTDKFYETETELRLRQKKLITTVAIDDPEWMLAFILWLRTEANLRTGSLVIAAESVHARLLNGERGLNRQIIGAALQRPDEPAEMLAYWVSNYGRNIPKPVKRGVADAVVRLYNEKAFLKYDSPKRAFRFADVIQVTHPTFPTNKGDALARHIIKDRLGIDGDPLDREMLPTIETNKQLRTFTPEQITRLAKSGDLSAFLRDAGMTWEDIPSLVNGPWTAELWEAIAPSMGVMALIRNLRNFDEAGVSPTAAKAIAAKISDPEAVRRSRVLPFRMLSAFKNVTNVRWAAPLEAAIQATLTNLPALKGRTLILVDCSGSMFGFGGGWGRSSQTTLTYAEQAALFGSALALRAEDATLVHYGSSAHTVDVPKGGSLLPLMQKVRGMGGTDTAGAARKYFNSHDRVILLTDEQHGYGRGADSVIPKGVPLITFNLAGYRYGGTEQGPNRLTFSSLSDSAWQLVDMWGNGSSGWPWEV